MAKSKIINKGQVFGHLTIIKEIERKNKKRRFEVKCDCGKIKSVSLGNLLNGSTISCGCIKAKKHNMSSTRLYHIWQGMRYRCYTKTCCTYKNYGAKGITVCEEWNNSFQPFYEWSINNGYKDDLTIDRIDTKGNYCPENCRWATISQQHQNLSMLSTNTSGYKGVSWSKQLSKWLCNISINNKTKRIGAYKTQKEAVEARNKFIDDNNLQNHQKNVYIGELVRYE